MVLEHEHVELGAVQLAFHEGQGEVFTVASVTARAMGAELLRRVRSGKLTARTLKSQRLSKFRGSAKASARFRSAYEGIAARGKLHAGDEIRSQQE